MSDNDDPADKIAALGIESQDELRARISTPKRLKLMADFLELEPSQVAEIAKTDLDHLLVEKMLAGNPRRGHKRGALVPAGTRTKAVSPLREAELAGAMRANPPPPPEVDLLELLTAVRNQGQRSTCVAFATVAAFEGFRIEGGDSKKASRFSPQFSYWSAKERDGYADEEGTFVESAFEGLTDDGVCKDATWPYTAEADPDKKEGQGPPPKKAVTEGAKNTIVQAKALKPKAPAQMKKALRERKLVVLSVLTWPFWDEDPYNETGRIALPTPDEDSDEIAHAICLFGYRDNPNRPGGGDFLFRNSWGRSWGDEGNGTLPYGYVKLYGIEAYVVEG